MPLLVAPCSTQKGNPWIAVGTFRDVQRSKTLLALRSCTSGCDALMEAWKNPQESALGQTETWQICSCDVVKHQLHWRKERDVAGLGNLLKVTLPVVGRARARIQC